MRLRVVKPGLSPKPHPCDLLHPTNSLDICRAIRLAGLLCLGLIVGSSAIRADGTLTLQLPPSQKALEARAAEAREAAARAYQAREAVRASAGSARYHTPTTDRGQLPWRGQSRDEQALGRLGQLTHNATIHRQPSPNSQRLVTVPTGTYVAVEGEQGGWYGVLMADKTIGWLSAQDVTVLNYAVVAKVDSGSWGDYPTGSDSTDIYPHGNAPFFNGDASSLLTEAYKFLGVPYVWGGNTERGLDCSGFVKKVFGAFGYPLPRLGSDQMAYGMPVPVDQLRAGDRLYFGKRSDRLGVTHTGIYIANGNFIHASSAHHRVTISNLREPLYSRLYVCARR